MGAGMNKVLPGLYIGNIRDSDDANQLEKHNITHIVRVFEDPKMRTKSNLKYLCIEAHDTASQNLEQHFSSCIEFIHNARLEGGNVLVHCLAGVSRSATIVTAYVMTITELSWYDAINAVRSARSIVNPNPGFQKQLKNYEETCLKKVKDEIVVKYGEINSEDFEIVKKLLEDYNVMETVETERNDSGNRYKFVSKKNSSAAENTPSVSKLIKQGFKEKKERELKEAEEAASAARAIEQSETTTQENDEHNLVVVNNSDEMILKKLD